jgi:hypothetical protein
LISTPSDEPPDGDEGVGAEYVIRRIQHFACKSHMGLDVPGAKDKVFGGLGTTSLLLIAGPHH